MKMRIAWKLRVAGWILPAPRPTIEAISSASCAVRVIGALLARGDQAARDLARQLLLAVGPQHVADLALVGARQPLRRALAGLVVHAHVERAVVAEGETALGFVELRRGHAEVEQHAVQAGGGGIPQRQVGERAAPHGDARIPGGQLGCVRDRHGILVHHQQPSCRAEPVEHPARWPPRP
jgi:hypothetical protein